MIRDLIFVAFVAFLAGIVAAVVIELVATWGDEPTGVPSGVSSECTEADLDDGACLTWDDIREQPVYSEGARP